MARLNEPPVTGESLESLKRRFIRQNREITRANSTQSIRIRNLECETSRLLSENITLREQNIQLQRQLESNGNQRNAVDKLDRIRGQLETKLAELGGLVYELGTVHKKTRRSSAFNGNSPPDGHTPKKSPDQRNWKNGFTLSDVTGQQEGRLPPILEDKLYPRKTLESADIAGMLADAANLTDSPDLGPPPIAHFEDTDPIRYDGGHENVEEDSGLGFTSMVKLNNLETRKKRRESSYTNSSLSDPADSTAPSSTVLGTPMPAPSLKSGAKRKFSARDGDETGDSSFSIQKDGFQFNRREGPVDSLPRTAASSESTQIQASSPAKPLPSLPSHSTKPSRDNSTATSTSRKALGEKSVNNSPVKSKRHTADATSDPQKDIARKPRDRENERSKAKPLGSKPQRPPKADGTLKPKPPVVDSIAPAPGLEPDALPEPDPEPIAAPLSPSTFAPSTTATPYPPPTTPPPADLPGIRPSRRPRGNVSYAEPSLRDKMRRPTKELVAAVGGDEKLQRERSASFRAESELRNDGDAVTVTAERKVEKPRAMRTVVVKTERSEEETWKDLPLANVAKHGETNLGEELSDTIETGRKEEGGPDCAEEGEEDATIATKKTSGSSAAIAALAGPSRAKSSRLKEIAPEPKDPDLVQDLAPEAPMPKPSNPATDDSTSMTKHTRASSTTSTAPRPVPSAANRASRRNSSVPEAMGKDIAQRTAGSSSQDTLARAGSTRRREGASVARRNAVEGSGEIEIRGGGGVAGLGVGKGEGGDRERERAERVAGRRRSMMI